MSELERPAVTILVVDDDPDLLQSLRVLLESYDYLVIMAANAAAAIAAVTEQKPDLVLTDIYMPDADGFELRSSLVADAEQLPDRQGIEYFGDLSGRDHHEPIRLAQVGSNLGDQLVRRDADRCRQ